MLYTYVLNVYYCILSVRLKYMDQDNGKKQSGDPTAPSREYTGARTAQCRRLGLLYMREIPQIPPFHAGPKVPFLHAKS